MLHGMSVFALAALAAISLIWGTRDRFSLSVSWSSEAVSPVQASAFLDFSNVDAEGFGATPEACVEAAKKSAVVQALGEYISAESRVRDFVLEFDSVTQFSEGFVDNVLILEHARKEGEIWRAKIRCRVSRIDERLGGNPTLRQFLTRRVVVFLPDSFESEEQGAAYREVAAKLEEFLIDRGFRVFVQRMALLAFQEIAGEFSERISSDLYEEVRSIPADFVIYPRLERRDKDERSELKIAFVARNRVGVKFANVSRDYPATLQKSSDWEAAASMLAPIYCDLLYRKIVQKISQIGGGDEWTLYFQGYDDADRKKIKLAVSRIATTSPARVVDDTAKNLIVDLAACGDVSSIVGGALDEAKIPFRTMSMGNWAFFAKPQPWRLWASAGFSVFCLALAGYLWYKRRRKTHGGKAVSANA